MTIKTLHWPKRLLLCALLIPTIFFSGLQQAGAQRTSTRLDRQALAAAVRAEFLHAWNAYKKYAWGHDGLKPLSKVPYDWYGSSLCFTPVDALDTMILMGLKEEADSTREFIVAHLKFDRNIAVKNFEITIRLLGGLLSSYQLTGDRRLLALAEDLGKRLMPAFNSPTGLPYVNVNLMTGAVRDSISNPAESGTLLVEFGTLSKLTGDTSYYEAAKRSLVRTYTMRSRLDLVGEQFNVVSGRWTRTVSHTGAAIDSYLEYLLKCAILFDDRECRAMWEVSKKAIDRYVADTVDGRLWYGRVDMRTGARLEPLTGELEAFLPATLALGGDIPRAAALQESMFAMWTRHGLECEEFNYRTMEAVRPRYMLAPEIMESAYYLFQYTQDPKYLAMGKALFDSLRTYCRADEGYAQIQSVISKEKMDYMESYFLAETLKYLYLLFAPPETLDFRKVIFNTEAHPIRRTW